MGDLQDPKMEVLYHIRSYFGGIFPYIGLKNRPKIYGTRTSVLNRILKISHWKCGMGPQNLGFTRWKDLDSPPATPRNQEIWSHLRESPENAGEISEIPRNVHRNSSFTTPNYGAFDMVSDNGHANDVTPTMSFFGGIPIGEIPPVVIAGQIWYSYKVGPPR